MNAFALSVHVLSAVVWVGGMFFAYIVLRPAAAALEPPVRLQMWAGVFKRFFPWVWMVVIVLLFSGYWMVFQVWQGFAGAPGYVHLMQLLGLVMMGLFAYLYYRPYPLFKDSVNAEQWPEAAVALNRIRHIILVNLILGILIVVAASGGRYL